ncbi:hypothetical protein RN001_002521 [Aquatica leii]|uniref:Transmembrane protein n=1 Tax=Aquatica leii TaxID=1421715 RepID=A0AAN7QB57_9COLE|nr:hypothetical protein RN001_002521 [Aquatica leii]
MDQYIQRANSIGSNEDLRRQVKKKKEDRESEESKQLQLMEEMLQQITALRQNNLEIKINFITSSPNLFLLFISLLLALTIYKMSTREKRILELALSSTKSDQINEASNQLIMDSSYEKKYYELQNIEPQPSTSGFQFNNYNNANYDNSGDEFGEDDDDSVKDIDYLLTRIDSETSDESDIENISPAITDIIENNNYNDLMGFITTFILGDIINQVAALTAQYHISMSLTKQGTFRKRRRHETSLAATKQAKIHKSISEHGVKTGCSENCKKHCSQNITKQRQEHINKQYWAMSQKEKKPFVLHGTIKNVVKRQTVTK